MSCGWPYWSHIARVWSGWYRRLPGLEDIELNNVWSYAALFIAGMVIHGVYKGWIQSWHYRRHRPRLANLAAQAGLNRYQLLARLEGDEAVKEALAMIKRDRGGFGGSV